MRYLRNLYSKQLDWEGINQPMYLSGIASHVGQMEINENNFGKALECFDFALDIFKQIKNQGETNDDPTIKILLFTILYSIGQCFYEDGEFERAKFFNKKVNFLFQFRS